MVNAVFERHGGYPTWIWTTGTSVSVTVTTSILAFLLKNRTTLIAVVIKIIVHGSP